MPAYEHDEPRQIFGQHVLGDALLLAPPTDEVARKIRSRLVAAPEPAPDLVPAVDEPEPEPWRELAERSDVCLRPQCIDRLRHRHHPVQMHEPPLLLLPHPRVQPPLVT